MAVALLGCPLLSLSCIQICYGADNRECFIRENNVSVFFFQPPWVPVRRGRVAKDNTEDSL